MTTCGNTKRRLWRSTDRQFVDRPRSQYAVNIPRSNPELERAASSALVSWLGAHHAHEESPPNTRVVYVSTSGVQARCYYAKATRPSIGLEQGGVLYPHAY